MNRFKLFYLLIVMTCMTWSCSNTDTQNVETISMEELMGEVDGDLDTTLNKDSIPLDSLIFNDDREGRLIGALQLQYDTTSLEDTHPMDRYGFSSKQKIKFVGKETVPYGKTNMVTPKADFFIYNFRDSIVLNSAFYNWLDCFSNDCVEVKINQNIDAIKTPPSLTLVYDTTLIDIRYMCEHSANDWSGFEDSIISKYGKDYRYRIEVNCGGPLTWK